jgi:hypothetical protein
VVVVELRLDCRRGARGRHRARRAGELRRHAVDPRQCGWSPDLGAGVGDWGRIESLAVAARILSSASAVFSFPSPDEIDST